MSASVLRSDRSRLATLAESKSTSVQNVGFELQLCGALVAQHVLSQNTAQFLWSIASHLRACGFDATSTLLLCTGLPLLEARPGS